MSTPLRVEMISTGNEVLHGEIIDSNAAWLAQTLYQAGLPLAYRSTVGDDINALVSCFLARSHEADIVIVNGGLGPTCDDLSAEAAARAFNQPLVLNHPWLERLRQRYEKSGRPMPDSNRKQALLPQHALLVDNPVGTACGFIDRKSVV